MTGLVRKATLLTAAGLMIASAAMAGVPSPTNSTVPACISLVGSTSSVGDPLGTFTVIVRDLANNPLSGASVVVDLSLCSDLRICSDQLDAGALVNCPAKTTRKFTGLTGAVTFTVLGGSVSPATTLLGGGRIYANGTLIGSPTASAFDLDNASGLGANDLSAWVTDFGSGQPFGRSDYDCSGALGANDLSLWVSAFGGGGSTASCSTSCP